MVAWVVFNRDFLESCKFVWAESIFPKWTNLLALRMQKESSWHKLSAEPERHQDFEKSVKFYKILEKSSNSRERDLAFVEHFAKGI